MATEITSNLFSLGRIEPVPGTPADVFANFTDLRNAYFPANMILFQSDPDNTGMVFIGSPSLDVATKTGINYILVSPGDSFSIGSTALNVYDIAKFKVDTQFAGDGVLVSVYIR